MWVTFFYTEFTVITECDNDKLSNLILKIICRKKNHINVTGV